MAPVKRIYTLMSDVTATDIPSIFSQFFLQQRNKKKNIVLVFPSE